ncbi:unnamed protein product [Nezara viridula]|uniref:Uncharacterized protein n=1 Tax=Nezara viridula TaxID=85310 RepID=A0A9P0MW87_NEZVI|nr:unnamed protein product [Nezara viridula]
MIYCGCRESFHCGPTHPQITRTYSAILAVRPKKDQGMVGGTYNTCSKLLSRFRYSQISYLHISLPTSI